MVHTDKKSQRWKGKIWADEQRGVPKEAGREGNRDVMKRKKKQQINRR